MSIDETIALYETPGGKKSWGEFAGMYGEVARSAFAEFKKQKQLERLGKWNEGGKLNPESDTELFVGGFAMPHASGVCDLSPCQQMCLDTIKRGSTKDIVFEYADEEQDPLRWGGNSDRYDPNEVVICIRHHTYDRDCGDDNWKIYSHIVVGPDLIAEKAWEKMTVAKYETQLEKLPNKKYNWNPDKVPSKITKPREIKFKMYCGEDMVFWALPWFAEKVSDDLMPFSL